MSKAKSPQALRTSTRLSLQFALLYAALSAIVFIGAYWFTYYEVKDWMLDQMLGDAETLITIYERDGAEALVQKVDALGQVSFEDTRVFQLLDHTGKALAGNILDPVLSDVPDFLSAETLGVSFAIFDEVEGYWMRTDAMGPYQLVQGSGDHIIGEVLEALGTALLVGYLCVVVLGLLVGVRVGRLTEQRITQISATLSRVSDGQLNARIASSGPIADDLSWVSAEINAMLDQVKRLLESQEQISNDIAHDMRTPLQRLRQRLETMRENRNLVPEDVEASLEQTDEIIATFNALLRIAQIEAVNKTERFEPTDLEEIIKDVADVFEPIAEDNGMRITTQIPAGPLKIIGDRELLTQLVVNLVENAISHCRLSTQIEMSVSATSATTVLSVSDNGPGIDPAIREQVLQRFFRAESSRNSPGNGLGLALVKAIADIHGAKIEILSNDPGTLFKVGFPTESAQKQDI